MKPTEPCELCACKHLAKARGMLMETKLGHEESFWFALGEIALAEDHMVEKQPDLANEIRDHRRGLELYPRYAFPFTDLILRVAAVGGYDVRVLLDENGFLTPN